MSFQKKYSWEALVKESQLEREADALSVHDEVIDLFSKASEEDRKKILEIFKGLVGEEYAKDMITSDDVESFKKITSAFEESALHEIKEIMQTARNRNDEYDYESAIDEDDYSDLDFDDDEDEDGKEDKKKSKKDFESKSSALLTALVQQAQEKKVSIPTVLAAWEEKDRKALFNEFVSLLGSSYSKDMVRDYKPRGTARDVSSPQSSGQLDESKGMSSVDGGVSEQKDSSTTDASSNKNVKTASKADRKRVQDLFRGLLGSNFAAKLVEEYTVKGKQSDKKSSGQTKTASFDPWGLNKVAKEKENNEYAICTDSVGREDEEKYKSCKEQVKKQNAAKKK